MRMLGKTAAVALASVMLVAAGCSDDSKKNGNTHFGNNNARGQASPAPESSRSNGTDSPSEAGGSNNETRDTGVTDDGLGPGGGTGTSGAGSGGVGTGGSVAGASRTSSAGASGGAGSTNPSGSTGGAGSANGSGTAGGTRTGSAPGRNGTATGAGSSPTRP